MSNKVPRFLIVLCFCFGLLAGSWTVLGQTRGDAFTLPSMLLPDEGGVASYIITEKMSQTVEQRTGIFLFAPAEEMESFYTRSVGVRYTVLGRGLDGSEAWVRVEAQPLDPDSGVPISAHYWDTTYRVTPTAAERERGSVIPEDYETIVNPSWLSEWMLTPLDQRPTGALVPGFRWQASGEIPGFTDVLPVDEAAMTLVGTFVGWEQLPDGYGGAARIVEMFTGSGEIVDELEEGLQGLIDFEMRGSTRYAVIPNAFPFGAELELTGLMGIKVEAGEATFGMAGGVGMNFTLTRSVRRDDQAAASWFTGELEAVLEPAPVGGSGIGETVTGVLDEASPTFDDDSAYSIHLFHGEEGQTVVIRARSTDFDTYLMLFDPNDEFLADNDDTYYSSDSMIIYRLPVSGDYTVIINSYWSGEFGKYTLTIEEAPGTDVLLALETVQRLKRADGLTARELDEIEQSLWLLMDVVYGYRQY